MKKTSIHIKIGLLITLAVILLSSIAYLSYRSISSIVHSIHIDVKPELRLLSIREISMDLEKAENCIRKYTISRDTRDLQPYYNIISGIDEKLSKLRLECSDEPKLLEQVNAIGKLIEENIVIWNELLYLSHDQKVYEYLKQLSYKLDSASLNDRKTEKGILKRVFSRSNKDQFDKQEVIDNLQKIEEQNKVTKEKLMTRESQLAATGNEIKEQFYDLIGKMESEFSQLINEKALEANQLANKTYPWLALFSVSGALLAVLTLFIIVRYVRKTYAYQIALEKSKDEAEKLARTKELFMANMSHEIRTPVTAISGFTEQLLSEPLDENTIRNLKIIKSSSDHLARIIDDILDFSKLESGRLVLENVHFSIRQIFEDVYALFEKSARQNNTKLFYSLSPDIPPVLLGDPYRLKQIMINLVGNSVKFTKEGAVHFSVKAINRQPAKIEMVMEFIDTGIGIDKNKLNLIFEDFTQAEMNTTRKYGGTGLGLSIVKKLVELHHGSIECRSRKNHGTKITCHLPYLTGDENKLESNIKAPISIPEEIRKLKILVVDDEEYNRLLFKAILNKWKLNFHEAVNGLEALEMLKDERFDLVFMDVLMPGIDGLQTTRLIRNELKIKKSDMPVIGISAACTDKDRQKYKKDGMNAFLPKPFTEEMLLNVILSVNKDVEPVAIPGNGSIEEYKPASTDKINLDNLYHISAGDEQFVKNMLITFIDSTDQGLKGIHKAALNGQWESVASLAHKISPPCRHIGASDLHRILKKIEETIRDSHDTNAIDSLTTESIREFEIVRELIHQHIAKIN